MNAQTQRGFTIVEVMLFLAISGLLAVLLLGGWGTMINTQRYKDSTRTLQTFLQQQYNLVYNVENGRSADLACDQTNGVKSDGGPGDPRGQTGCILIGRYVRINGPLVTVSAIVGKQLTDGLEDSDKQAILDSDPQVVIENIGLSESRLAIPWQASVVGKHNSPDAANYAVAIIRSPLTGTVHTYTLTTPGDGNDLALDGSFVDPTNESKDIQLCLNPGTAFSGGRMAVVIGANASAQTFITVAADGDNQCND